MIWSRFHHRNRAVQKSGRGFTLIELVVVLAILGVLIALAIPRYLGSRRNALVHEGQGVLQELKTLAWAYYQQHLTFVGASIGSPNNLGFTEPSSGCWVYSITAQSETAITFRADDTPGARLACSILPGTGNITLTVSGNGSSLGNVNF